jgi:hypothetical protein
MDRELDEIEPGSADAVMDPARWGPATAIMHAMHRDGVDISDSTSVDAWIAQQNAGMPAGHAGGFAARQAGPLTWDGAFGQVLDTTLEAADETEPLAGEDLDLAGHGLALVTELFPGARAGVPVARLSENLKSAAIADVPPDAAERQWAEWAGAHGDPAGLLPGQLAKLSAVTVANGLARLEPLALHAIAARLRASGVHMPDLPPPGEMTTGGVVLLSMLGAEEDFAADFASWLAERAPEDAARELLAFAAAGSPAVRMAAVQVVSRLDDAAEPALREALGRRELRCYAKGVPSKLGNFNAVIPNGPVASL